MSIIVLCVLHVLIHLIFVRWILTFQFHVLGNWGTEKSGNLPKATQLVNVLSKEYIRSLFEIQLYHHIIRVTLDHTA